uniref:NADH-ubiquinone oxidoreductase chain 4L n=1 Tax=Pyrrhopeplus carduelis TaxID=1928078 RepID=A0A4Y1JVR1_9HEMI|nr:NADH dehydrogenase subunit 4L [Pyrrhopeplus carduelis]APO08815.1 NADH dehydrogenase subunit 4L [Pyrrhopeplus carduelis]
MIIILSLIIMFVSGVVVFCLSHKHLLLTLFSMEFLVLSLYFMFFMFLLWSGCEIYFILFFLVFSVCEGALGLGVLVSMIRSHGNDFLSSLSILSW